MLIGSEVDGGFNIDTLSSHEDVRIVSGTFRCLLGSVLSHRWKR